jgi:hypothetical protein
MIPRNAKGEENTKEKVSIRTQWFSWLISALPVDVFRSASSYNGGFIVRTAIISTTRRFDTHHYRRFRKRDSYFEVKSRSTSRGLQPARLQQLQAALLEAPLGLYWTEQLVFVSLHRVTPESRRKILTLCVLRHLLGHEDQHTDDAVVESLSRSVCARAHRCYFHFATAPFGLNWIDRACGSAVVVIGMENGQSNRRNEPPRITYSRNRNECRWKVENV